MMRFFGAKSALFAITLLFLGLAMDKALAQAPASNAGGALISVNQRAQHLLEEFKINPAGPISRNPNGGGALAAEIRDVLLADKTQLSGILSLVPLGTAAQQEALGSGLGLARLLYIRDAEFTSEVQTRVVELDNRNVLAGYSVFGGGGLAALSGGVPPAAPALVLGPVGPVASAPAANSAGRGGSSGTESDSGSASGVISPRAAAAALSVTNVTGAR
ncbi:hypothetical protein [Bosea sp. 124]|uniref:hypothetical protein n=1 Tax=Bosea sp. 124 TaxID=2135642 RepID=UPI000D41FB25|nr:hypothetical protein [Bosea sp. 124]PTM41728.1 hypothetical protein C8D03_3301 [Bosea sp. 124]